MRYGKVRYARSKNGRYIGREERSIYQYALIKKYLEKKLEGKRIGDFFLNQGICSFSLYAVTEFTNFLLKDIETEKSGVAVSEIIDRNAVEINMTGFLTREVIGVQDMCRRYESGSIKTIVVCSIFHEQEVFHELILKGIRQEDLISVIDVIYY